MAQLLQLNAENIESGLFRNLLMDLKCHDPVLFCNITEAEKIAEKDPATQTNFLLSSKAYLLLDVIKLEESFDFTIIPLFLFKRSFQAPSIFSLKYRCKLTWYHVLFFYLLKLEFYDLKCTLVTSGRVIFYAIFYGKTALQKLFIGM